MERTMRRRKTRRDTPHTPHVPASVREREEHEMAGMLQKAGYLNPRGWARRFFEEGMGPSELEYRLGAGELRYNYPELRRRSSRPPARDKRQRTKFTRAEVEAARRWNRNKYGLSSEESDFLVTHQRFEQIEIAHEQWREKHGYPAANSSISRGMLLDMMGFPGRRRDPRRITAAQRRRLPASKFADPHRLVFPRGMPIDTKRRADNAMARLDQALRQRHSGLTRARYAEFKARIRAVQRRFGESTKRSETRLRGRDINEKQQKVISALKSSLHEYDLNVRDDGSWVSVFVDQKRTGHLVAVIVIYKSGRADVTGPYGHIIKDLLKKNRGKRDPVRRYPTYPKTPRGRAKVERVLREYKHHELRSSGGARVKGRRQAVAIALAEGRRAEGRDRSASRRAREDSVWRSIHPDYRGKVRGEKAVLVLDEHGRTVLAPLSRLSEARLRSLLPKGGRESPT